MLHDLDSPSQYVSEGAGIDEWGGECERWLELTEEPMSTVYDDNMRKVGTMDMSSSLVNNPPIHQ